MSQVRHYDTPIRQGVVQRLQYGDKHVSEIAENLPTVKGNVHYHLQHLEEEGAIVKLDKEYWTKKEAHKKQRRLEQRFNKFKEKLERKIASDPNMGQFIKRYREFKRQKEKFEKMGFDLPSYTPEDIARSKRKTVERVLERNGDRKHRKFEQIQEYEKVYDFLERYFGIELSNDLRRIRHENPMLQEKLETAFT